jgi:hypothetical protein
MLNPAARPRQFRRDVLHPSVNARHIPAKPDLDRNDFLRYREK